MRFGSLVRRRVFGLGSQALLALLFAATLSAMSGQLFSGLTPPQALEVQYRETTAAATTSYQLTFTRGETGGTAVRITGGTSPDRTLPLSDTDLRGLDRTLAHFREVQGGRCSTVLSLSIARRNGSVVSPSEEHVDRTCTAPPGGLTFAALVARQP